MWWMWLSQVSWSLRSPTLTLRKWAIWENRCTQRGNNHFKRDIYKVFNVLRVLFKLLQHLCQFWFREDMAIIMKNCIILHKVMLYMQRNICESGLGASKHWRVNRLFENSKEIVWDSKKVPEEIESDIIVGVLGRNICNWIVKWDNSGWALFSQERSPSALMELEKIQKTTYQYPE